MKKKLHFIVAILAVMFSSIPAIAQELYLVEYAVSVPTNDLRDHVSQTSFRGLTLGYFSHFNESIVEGMSIGWNEFHERKSYVTYHDGAPSSSEIQYRHTDAVPIHFNGFYLFHPQNKLTPYAGAGVGIIYLNRTTDMGPDRWKEETWHFSLRPEGGVLYNFRDQINARLSVRYNEAFKTANAGDQSFLSFNFGVVFNSLH